MVADGVNALRSPDRSMLVITHYQRLLEYLKPDVVHVMANGRIVKTGGPELALELEAEGYEIHRSGSLMGVVPQLSAFETALAASLPTGELRAALETGGLPHRRVEAWKWSDLRAALAKAPAGAGTLSVNASRKADVIAPLDHQPDLLMPRLAAGLTDGCPVYDLKDGESLSLDFEGNEGAAHHIAAVNVPAGVSATLHERYRVAAGGFANIALRIVLGEGRR